MYALPDSCPLTLIDPRYEWSIFSGPRIQTLPSQLLIGSKKVAAVSRGRIHVTNFKILEYQNIINPRYEWSPRFQTLPSVLLIKLKKSRGRYLLVEYT